MHATKLKSTARESRFGYSTYSWLNLAGGVPSIRSMPPMFKVRSPYLEIRNSQSITSTVSISKSRDASSKNVYEILSPKIA